MGVNCMKIIVLVLLLLSTPIKTYACSWAESTKEFEYSQVQAPSVVPKKPSFIVESVSRGHKDGTNCGGFGSIVLKIDPEPKDLGYIFSIAEGSVNELEFLQEPIVRIEGSSQSGIYSFIWFDGYSNRQEAIDVTLSIVAVSKKNQFSEPQFLKLKHPGVKVPWWKIW